MYRLKFPRDEEYSERPLSINSGKLKVLIHNSQSIACQQKYQKCRKLLSTRIYPTYATIWFPFTKKSYFQSIRSQYEKNQGNIKNLLTVRAKISTQL